MARVAIKLHGMEQVDSQPAALCEHLINDTWSSYTPESPDNPASYSGYPSVGHLEMLSAACSPRPAPRHTQYG
jgi:hypothetical protein